MATRIGCGRLCSGSRVVDPGVAALRSAVVTDS